VEKNGKMYWIPEDEFGGSYYDEIEEDDMVAL
jgi:hypothetical protein